MIGDLKTYPEAIIQCHEKLVQKIRDSFEAKVEIVHSEAATGPIDAETSSNIAKNIQMTDHFPALLAGAGKVSRINTILQNTPKDIRMTDHVPALLAHTITVREE